jgi:hypothetical protein
MESPEVKSWKSGANNYPPAVFVLTASSVDDSDDGASPADAYDAGSSPGGLVSPMMCPPDVCERKLSADAVLTSNPKRDDEDDLLDASAAASQLITRSWSEFTLSAAAARKCSSSSLLLGVTARNGAAAAAGRGGRCRFLGGDGGAQGQPITHVTAFAQFRVRRE